MGEEELPALLERFGLSEKAIDTYLAILEQGTATASTIADVSGVSKRYVYSISEELEERGFVQVDDHAVPTEIRARPPEAVVDRLSRTVEEIQPEIEQRYTQTERAGDQFEVIKARQTVRKRIQTLLETAEEEVTISLPASVLPEIRSTLRETVDRGVMVLLLLGTVEDDVQEADRPESMTSFASAVRSWNALVPTMVTTDQRHGLIAPSQMLTTATSETKAIAITQEQLVPVLVGSFLANYWPVAEEIAVTKPADLPRTYESFRHAVFQIARHLDTGTPLRATVQGQPVGEEAFPSTLEGEVTSVRQSLVRPETSRLPVENRFELVVDGDAITVGGKDAFLEEYEARSVTLEQAEE
jgi:sugar-specific transcriptional regulator TrmB